MGGNGSGPYTVKTKGWEILEFAERLLSYVERSLFDDAAALNDEWLTEQKAKLGSLSNQFKAACERERTNGNGKHG